MKVSDDAILCRFDLDIQEGYLCAGVVCCEFDFGLHSIIVREGIAELKKMLQL